MSWDVSKLFGLTGAEFELQRSRIIAEYIQSVPEKHRKAVHLTQLNLDLARARMSDQEFSRHLSELLRENLENLNDQLIALKHTISGPPPVQRD